MCFLYFPKPKMDNSVYSIILKKSAQFEISFTYVKGECMKRLMMHFAPYFVGINQANL